MPLQQNFHCHSLLVQFMEYVSMHNDVTVFLASYNSLPWILANMSKIVACSVAMCDVKYLMHCIT